MDYFDVSLFYGGKFTPSFSYVGGTEDYIENCVPEVISLVILDDIARQLGYMGSKKYYYRMTGRTLKNGLRLLSCDKDLLDMVAQLPQQRVVDIYIEGDQQTLGTQQSQCTGADEVEIVEPTIPKEVEPTIPKEVELPKEVEIVEPTEHVGLTSAELPKGVETDEVEIENDQSEPSYESDESFFLDSGHEQSDDDGLYENNIDDGVEWGGFQNSNASAQDEVVDEVDEVDEEDVGDVSSDELCGLDSQSDDDGNPKHMEFRESTDMKKVEFKTGLLFSNAKTFREAVREYSIQKGKDIKFVKNESARVRAVCASEQCPWEIMASKAQRDEGFQVKTYKGRHDCGRSFKVRHVNSKWIARTYMDSIRTNPTMPIEHLQDRVRTEFVVNISRTQTYRAKRKAMDLIEGTYVEQYARLWDYCAEIRRANPNTTVIMKTIPSPDPDGQPRFERLYICLGALKEGMLSGCRKFVCMDACHLKGPHGGQLIVAVGIDANNQSFPFAYAVVEAETKDSWVWFLELIKEDLQIVNSSAWTFMSDKQKGLVPALKAVVPNAEIRFCTRHLYTNFRDHYKGLELRKILWEAARATNVADFGKAMEKMRSTDINAYNWLAGKPPSQWSRSHFSTLNKCDVLVNNLCEGFNKDIRKARDKPILSMLEELRCYLMQRMAKRRKLITKWTKTICPNVLKKVEKYKEYVGGCSAMWSGEGHYQVYCPPQEQYSLDLGAHTCSCRRWDLKGIPCTHAMAALVYQHDNIEERVNMCYATLVNASIYKGIIYPINGWDMWPKTGFNPVLPPNYGRAPGRPKKSRRKEREEVENANQEKLSRANGTLRCGNCGLWGHNLRSCKNQTNPDIRRRPSGGIVFQRPSGRPSGRPRGVGVGRGTHAARDATIDAAQTPTGRGGSEGEGVRGRGATRGGRVGGRGGGRVGGRGVGRGGGRGVGFVMAGRGVAMAGRGVAMAGGRGVGRARGRGVGRAAGRARGRAGINYPLQIIDSQASQASCATSLGGGPL